MTEEGRSRAHEEGEEPLTEVAPEDLHDHANMFDSSTSCNLQARLESAANKEGIPADDTEGYYEDLMKSREVWLVQENCYSKTSTVLPSKTSGDPNFKMQSNRPYSKYYQ